MLASMNIEHELGQRTFEPRQTLLEHDEAGARQLGRDREIHLSERFAQVEMLLGLEAVVALGTEAVPLDISTLVVAVGHIVGRQVGKLGKPFLQAGFRLLGCRFERRDAVLQLGDLGHQLVGARVVLLGFGLADLLGGGVAARLRLLQLGNGATAALVAAQKRLDQRVAFRRRHAAPLEPTGELVGIVTNPFDVVHGAGASIVSGRSDPAIRRCPEIRARRIEAPYYTNALKKPAAERIIPPDWPGYWRGRTPSSPSSPPSAPTRSSPRTAA